MKFAIDLLWIRCNKVGGIEAYIRNLLSGLSKLEDDFEAHLLTSIDNSQSFEEYKKDKRFKIHVCDVYSKDVGKRIVWQNKNMGKFLKKQGINLCFEPYYCKPIFISKKIKFVTTIHDLQALHYPEYFSKFKVLWMKMSWYLSVKTSEKIIAISDYVKNDIEKNYKPVKNKVQTIYNPIIIKKDEILDEKILGEKYNIEKGQFYFTVTSLLPHKNVETLIKIIKKIKENKIDLPKKLVISGVGGKSRKDLTDLIEKFDLKNEIILTEFISNEERNTLYKYCKTFLFPSVFEGFGMPALEAMLLDTCVITTEKTSIPEVTCNKAVYVKDPYNVDEWIEKMCENQEPVKDFDFSIYEEEKIAKEYLESIKSVLG